MNPFLSHLALTIYAFVFLLGALALLWRTERKHAAETLRDAIRTGEDKLAEKQKERDLAVTATITEVLKRLGELRLAEDDSAYRIVSDLVTVETVGVQAMIDAFREKVMVLDAATKHAQDRVRQAAAEVEAIRAENTLHRTLLEKSLSLPLDTPPAHREMFLHRCQAVMESPRATFDCPSEEFWSAYVARHKARYEKGVSL